MKRILVADDDPFTQSLFANVLKRAGYEAVLTADGLDTLKVLADDSNFDLILSDLRMPKMDGLHLLDELTQGYSSIPVIITSVHNQADVIDTVTKRGASFLAKPFTPEKLINAVHMAAIERPQVSSF